ncbi:Ribonuclease II [Yarrowia sp. C11]|nr:Ribonuclease II [Yarrowia sp. E02]KAG5371739.1 Ribonuclease II [Yarrowia sp. C11]
MRSTRALLRQAGNRAKYSRAGRAAEAPLVKEPTYKSKDGLFQEANYIERLKMYLEMRIEDPLLADKRAGYEYTWRLAFDTNYVPLSKRFQKLSSMSTLLSTKQKERELEEGMMALANRQDPGETFRNIRDDYELPEHQAQWVNMAVATYEAEVDIKPYRKVPEGWTREKNLVSRDHAFVKSSPTIEDINRPPRVGDLIDVSIKKNLSDIGIIGEILPSGGFNVVMISGECRQIEGGVTFKMPFANPAIMDQFSVTVNDVQMTHVGIRPALVQEMTEFLRRANLAKSRVLEMLQKTVIPQRVITLNDLVDRMSPHVALHDSPLTPAMMYYATYLAVRSIPARWVIDSGQNTAIELLYINALDVAASETAINTVREGGKTLDKIIARFENVLSGTVSLDSLLLTPQERAILLLVKRFALGEVSHNDMAAKANVGVFMRKLKDYGEVIITQTLCMEFLTKLGYIPDNINPWKKALKLQIPYQGSSEQQDEIQTMYDRLTGSEFTKDLSEKVRENWVGKKRPFSNFYCIDGPDAHEIDDGVSLETRPDGSKYVHVLVADPASYFGVTSDVAHAAQSRVTTAYYPSGVVGMLPQVVQEFGLLQKGGPVRSLVISAKLSDSKDAAKSPIDMNSTEIRLVNVDGGVGLTYEHVENVLNGSQKSEHKSNIQDLHSLSSRLKKHRIASGAVNLDIPKIQLDSETGQLHQLTESNPEATLLVSELMILANSLVASFGAKHNIPLLYRYQHMEEENKKALEARDPTTGIIPFKAGISLWATIEMAYISADPKPHFSLAIPMYAQSTSPLRRYGDLLNHYQLHAHLQGRTPPFSHADVQKIIPHVFTRQRAVKKGQEAMESYRLKEWLLKRLKSGELYPINWTGMVMEPRRQEMVRVMVMELGIIADYHLSSPDVNIGDMLKIGKIVDIDLMERQVQVAEK